MQTVLKTAINDVIKDKGWLEVDFVIEHPADLSHGDFASNVALVLSKQVGEAPREIAEYFRKALEGKIENIEKIDIAGPGFINFHLKREFLSNEVIKAVNAGEQWGSNHSWQGKKVIVEYTDPNPFKEFHIGHLFTNAVGESIARLFMAQGADVKRVCYQGDVGMHVASAIYGMQQMGLTADSDFSAKDLGQAYALGATAAKEDEAVATEIKNINKAVYERSDEVINALYDAGRKVSLEYFETIYELVDTKFDHYFFESEAAGPGKELVLNHPDIFLESDGARVFRGEEYGLHSRVFLNSAGLPTYEAKELALAKLKADYIDYDHSVISTAAEINEYFKVLLKAMSFIYPDLAEKTEHIGHGIVRLESGKMSSRTGDVIAARDFIDEIKEAAEKKLAESGREGAGETLAEEIAIAAIKYSTLKGTIYQNSVFNKEQALSFEGASGPYLQYTHARINSVLEKAGAAGVWVTADNPPAKAYEIERLIYRFPEVVSDAFTDREPHQVATYLLELAAAFNTFYGEERIADTADGHAPYKALVAKSVQQTLKNGLWLLGIKAPNHI